MTISATICSPIGAAFHLILIPANGQAHTIMKEESEKLEFSRAVGGTYRIDLANLAPGIFCREADVGTGPFEEQLSQASIETLLNDAVTTLFNLANGISPCPGADQQLLMLWLDQLSRLVLDPDQAEKLDSLVTVAQQYALEAKV